MLTLTEEQRRKIEQNKAAAIKKKQQALQNLKNQSTCNLNRSKTPTVGNYKYKYGKSPAKFERKPCEVVIKAVCKMFGKDRFVVEMPYHEPSIEVFKSIDGRKYETDLKKWTFPLTVQSVLVSKLKSLKIVVDVIPDSVVRVLLEPDSAETVYVNWNKIDQTLRDYLMPFQVDGIRFGVQKKGKCLIADDMGLGKTIQALGLAHYYKENWPLLIICPSSVKFPWLEAIKTFLPSVQVNIQVLTSGKNQVIEGEIVISSYDLMKNCFDEILKRRFGVIIFDESHFLKNSKSLRSKVALQLASTAKNIILLSGTPALSRPQELYTQIYAIDPFSFKSFFEFGMRYCNGRKDKFGWNFSGSSNLEELEYYLQKKIMIRRLKADVIKQLPSKIRKIVVLHPSMVKSVKKKIKQLEQEYNDTKAADKHKALLPYYKATGDAKLDAVCEYIEDKLENQNKFIVFAHHITVINGICELLVNKKIDFIKIDGAVPSEHRKSLCDMFQNEESCRVAVLSIKAANCGITLTAAKLVIFAELYWNPGELTQAEDRAHRIGQQDSVLIEYLVAKGTLDEGLWQLCNLKLNTLNKVGLSKDNFKDSDTQELGDPKQPKLTSFLSSSNETSNRQSVDKFVIEEAEDEIFSKINLEEIENEYHVSSKKMKTCKET